MLLDEGDQPLLWARGVHKAYGGVIALKGVDLEVRPGEVHALMGQNGAGKSTLIKVIAGAAQPDAGSIEWKGQQVEMTAPRDALELGIRVIYQHLHLVEHLSIADNFSLGNEATRAGVIDRRRDAQRAREALGRLGVTIDPRMLVGRLATAERQLVEIARAIDSDAKVLIMDEPTASLGNEEVERLFTVVRDLASKGLAIIFISHRLDEVYGISDRITVLRDGATVGTYDTADLPRAELISLMVGKEVDHTVEPTSHATAIPVLQAESISTTTGLTDVSFTLHRGEVLGFFGLMGSGRTELARALFGADSIESGRILLDGGPLRVRDPKDAVLAGIGMVPEDRARQGALLRLSIVDNITAASSDMISHLGFLRPRRARQIAQDGVDRLSIRTPSVHSLVANLSGGNQQKVVLGKWLVREMQVLVLDEPTVGVDVGAKREIYDIINDITETGGSVILMSSEIAEITAVCDRVAVLREGRITGVVERPQFSRYTLVQLAMEGTLS